MIRLWGLIRTEFIRRLGSPTSWVFFLLLPLIFTAAVGAGLGGTENAEGPPEEERFTLYLVQHDQGTIADVVLDVLAQQNFDLIPTGSPPDDAYTLTVPADFSERLLQGEETTLTLRTRRASASDPAVEQAIHAARRRLGNAAMVAQAGAELGRTLGLVTTIDAERALFQALLLDTLQATAAPPALAAVNWPQGTTLAPGTASVTGMERASAGQLVTWVQITLLGTAEVLVDGRLRGTLKRMLITPTTRLVILSGKLLAGLLSGLLQMTILLVGGTVLFGVNWGRDPWAVALISFAFALATACLGVLLATFVKTRGQANSIVIGLSMAMAALGGAWYPLEITPSLYQQLVQALPSYWAMRAYGDLLTRNATVSEIAPYAGVLFAFAGVFYLIGVLRFWEAD